MLVHNNPKVSLVTRRWLFGLPQRGVPVDEGCLELIERALVRSADAHPGGTVHDLALRMGAPAERAELAGSIAELLCVACNLTDDIQDGDHHYLTDDTAVAVNVQTQLMCCLGLRTAEADRWEVPSTGAATRLVFEAGLGMLSGQRIEIVRAGWSPATYARVAELSAGAQFASYLQLAALAAGADRRPWAELGMAFGMYLQYVVDMESADERLEVLNRTQLTRAVERAGEELEARAAIADPAARELAGAMLRRGREALGAYHEAAVR